MLPPDPFGEAPAEPLSEDEYVEHLRDRERVEEFQRLLEPLGIRGVADSCRADSETACEEVHHWDWALLLARIDDALAGKPIAAIEPACSPDPDAYVSWDYCYGYADGHWEGRQ